MAGKRKTLPKYNCSCCCGSCNQYFYIFISEKTAVGLEYESQRFRGTKEGEI